LFNVICSDKLNKGFIHVNQFHGRCLKAVKTKLPRRESERRHHPLARHSDILMAVETRLSMLSMTFSKYVEAQQCCFIPGKVNFGWGLD
jgi:F-box protein 28